MYKRSNTSKWYRYPVYPGISFELEPTDLVVRLAYVNFDGAKALAASETIPLDNALPLTFLQNYCSEPIEAVTRLAGWVQSL